jgi:hypothetical protein
MSRCPGEVCNALNSGHPAHDRPHHLTITRHRDMNVVVLQAVWCDGDEPPMIVSFVPGSWKLILKRAVATTPVSIIPV